MKRSLKAALLSAFIFPGAGHFYLQKYRWGSLYVVTAFILLSLFVMNIINTVQQMINRLTEQGGLLDSVKMVQLISNQITVNGGQQVNLIISMLLVVWVVSVIDAYRVGQSPV